MPDSSVTSRLLDPIKRRIQSFVARAILTYVNNTHGQYQFISVKALDGESISDMVRPQNYGQESYPLVGSEAITLFRGGNREDGYAIIVHDRRYRPNDLNEGDVAIYVYGHTIRVVGSMIEFRRA